MSLEEKRERVSEIRSESIEFHRKSNTMFGKTFYFSRNNAKSVTKKTNSRAQQMICNFFFCKKNTQSGRVSNFFMKTWMVFMMREMFCTEKQKFKGFRSFSLRFFDADVSKRVLKREQIGLFIKLLKLFEGNCEVNSDKRLFVKDFMGGGQKFSIKTCLQT